MVVSIGAGDRGPARRAWRAARLPRFVAALALLAAGGLQAANEPLLFLGNEDLPPFVWQVDRVAQGLTVDLARAAAERAGLSVRIEAMEWGAAQHKLAAGEADALLHINPNPQRELLYDFTAPVLQSSFPIFRRASSDDVWNLATLAGRKVGVDGAGVPAQFLRQNGSAQLVTVPDWNAGFGMLAAGQIDAIVVDRWVGEFALQQTGVRGITVVDPPLLTTSARIAVKKGNRDLLARLDAGIVAIAADGTQQRILEKWRSKEIVYVTRTTFDLAVLLGAAGAVALLLLGAAYTRRTFKDNLALQQARATLEQRIAERTAELTRSAESLRASEHRYRRLIDNLGDAYAVADIEGRFVECNAAFCDLVGYGAEELRSKIYQEITPPQWHAAEAALVSERLLKHEGCEIFEKEYRRKDGTVVPVELRPYLIRDDAGRPFQMWAIVRDISARRAAQARLEELHRERQLILDNVSVAVLYLKQRRLVWGNRQLGLMMGCDVKALIGKPTSEFFAAGHDARYEELGEQLRSVLARGERFEIEVQGRRTNGQPFWAHATALAIDSADPLAGTIVCLEDIDERKRVAEQLVRARLDAEAASRAKTIFLTSMSHEIRTPLNAILGMAELVERGGVAAEQKRRLDEIQRAGRHLLGIVNDVLDLARIDAGRIELASEAVDIGVIVDEAVDLVRSAAQARHLALRVDVEPPGMALLGDPLRLRQALVNYLGNAVKFTVAGSVTVRSRVLEADADDVLVRFEVVDTGIGIAPDVLPVLFAPFEQVRPGSAGAPAGTGLGLAITRRLAEAMGGAAGAASEPGHGSTFWFTARLRRGLPAAGSTPPAPTEDAEAECRRLAPGRRVLLVEDNPINREVASDLLSHAGLTVDCAEDGATAIRAAAEGAYDLVLMDLQLPDLDGIEVARRIRQSPRGAKPPIVALTADAFSEVEAACRAAGMDGFLTKPIEPAHLFATVLAHLRPGGAAA